MQAAKPSGTPGGHSHRGDKILAPHRPEAGATLPGSGGDRGLASPSFGVKSFHHLNFPIFS